MATLILNIGLNVGDGSERLTLDTVIREVAHNLGGVAAAEVQQSNTEATAVLTVDEPFSGAFATAGCVYHISRQLRQEAIAYAVRTRGVFAYGDIVGPAAAKWGDFDPSRFLLPEAHKNLFD